MPLLNRALDHRIRMVVLTIPRGRAECALASLRMVFFCLVIVSVADPDPKKTNKDPIRRGFWKFNIINRHPVKSIQTIL